VCADLDSPDGLLHVDAVGKQITVDHAEIDGAEFPCGKLVIIGHNHRYFGDEVERLWEHHLRDTCTIIEN